MSWFQNGVNRQGISVPTFSEHSGNFSTSAWMYWESAQMDGAQRDWFTKGWVGNPNRRWGIGRVTTSIYFQANLAGTFRTCSTSTGVVAANNWYNIVTRKTPSQMEIWINNSLLGTFVDANGVNDGPVPFSLGYGDDNSHYAWGYHADLAVWHESIPTGVIQALSKGLSPLIWKSNLSGYWPMYNITTATSNIPDLSGNNFHAQYGSGSIPNPLHPSVLGFNR